jgi:hypothetical protein
MKLLYTLLFTNLLAVSAVGQSGLLAHFKFDGNVLDASGQGNLANNLGATLCPDRFGNPNSAYRFLDTTDKISVLQPAFDAKAIDTFTVSLWFRRLAFNFPSYNPHLFFVGEFKNYTVCVDAEYVNNSTSLLYRDRVIFYNYSPTTILDIEYHDTRVADSAWHQLSVIVHKTAGKVEFYLDGVSSGVKSFTASDLDKSLLTIGNHSFKNWAFIGEIDDFRIYNKALTKAEIDGFSSTELINENKLDFNAFPIPCDNALKLEIECDKVDKLLVYNQGGQVVSALKCARFTELNTSQLPSGTYYIAAMKDNLLLKTKTVVVTHPFKIP